MRAREWLAWILLLPASGEEGIGVDQATLIEQLRIERPAEAPRRSAGWWAAGVAVLVVALVAATYVWYPRAVPIQVAVAEPVTEGAAVPSSILDASGYVVARRQATVSAKITGKVVMVGIEEGQRVERDQVIARLDDTNAACGSRAGARRGRSEHGQLSGGRGCVRQRHSYLPT